MPTVSVEEKTHSDLDELVDEMGHNTFNGAIRELITFWRSNQGGDGGD